MRSPNGQRIYKTCEYCGKVVELHPYRANGFHYCSRSCRAKANPKKRRGINKICPRCGKSFYVIQARKDNATYCSMSCASKGRITGEKAPWWKGGKDKITLDCIVCGKTITRRQSTKSTYKFCSTLCHDVHRQNRVVLNCENCGKKFWLRKSHFDEGRKFCSQKCYRLHRPTSIEKSVRDALFAKSIYFIPEHRVGKYGIDIFIPSANLAVECDGDYWHKNTKERDSKKDAELNRQGIHVLRFSETEINKNLAHCVDKILSCLR